MTQLEGLNVFFTVVQCKITNFAKIGHQMSKGQQSKKKKNVKKRNWHFNNKTLLLSSKNMITIGF